MLRAVQADVERLAEPLLDGRGRPVVLFAGEHCHPSFYSTGHGAFLTGRSAAQTGTAPLAPVTRSSYSVNNVRSSQSYHKNQKMANLD